jgi:hypothetical protein
VAEERLQLGFLATGICRLGRLAAGAIALGRIGIERFIRIWIRHNRQAVRFAKPAPQVDRPAALAAERQSGRRAFFKLTLTDGTAHR